MNHVNRTHSQGFTLIELLLAMAFIAVLLLAIATTTLQISQIYNRGLTLKEVNQLSRTISDDLTNDVSGSKIFPLSTQFVKTTLGGRLCLGQYSYIWNYGSTISPASNPNTPVAGATYYNTGTSLTDIVRLARIPDATAAYCAMNRGSFVKTTVDRSAAVELVNDTDHNLAIHQFVVTTSSTATDALTGEQLYAITYTLGTNEQTAMTTDSSRNVTCNPPSVIGSDLTYCAVQQFSLVARTQNGVN